MDLSTIVEINQRYIFLFMVLIYSALFLFFTRNIKLDKISKAIALVWGKIISIVYILNYPLILYFYTKPEVNFEGFMILIISVYSISYLVLFLVFNVLTLEFIAKLTKFLTGYDLSKKLRIKTKW